MNIISDGDFVCFENGVYEVVDIRTSNILVRKNKMDYEFILRHNRKPIKKYPQLTQCYESIKAIFEDEYGNYYGIAKKSHIQNS